MAAPSWPRIAWKRRLGIGARASELAGMADAGRICLDQHPAGPVASQPHGLDRHRRSGAVGNIGSNVHDDSRGITDRIKIADGFGLPSV
jgi:hypothetical protein